MLEKGCNEELWMGWCSAGVGRYWFCPLSRHSAAGHSSRRWATGPANHFATALTGAARAICVGLGRLFGKSVSSASTDQSGGAPSTSSRRNRMIAG